MPIEKKIGRSKLKKMKRPHVVKVRGHVPSATNLPKAINELSLHELIEVSDVTVARSKGIRKPTPKSLRAKVVVAGIESVQKRDRLKGMKLMDYVNHAIVVKNQSSHLPSEAARIELRKLMSDDE